jgi:UDP-N-acetylmuramyl tripeptide synthase
MGAPARLAMKIPLSLMRFTLQKTTPPKGKLEPIGTAAELAIYVDGARTEPEIAEAIENVREITKGRVLVAIASVAGESVERRVKLGHTAAVMADFTGVINFITLAMAVALIGVVFTGSMLPIFLMGPRMMQSGNM